MSNHNLTINIEKALATAKNVITDHRAMLADQPVHAMSWCDGAINAAATIQVCTETLAALKAETPLPDILKNVLQRVLQSKPGMAGSGAHELYRQQLAVENSRMYQYLVKVSDYNMVDPY